MIMRRLKLWSFVDKETVNISLFAIVMPPAYIWICGRSMGARIHSVRLGINCIRFVLDLQAHMRLGNVGVRYTDADSTTRGSRENRPRNLPEGASARPLSSLCQALGQVDSFLRKNLLSEDDLQIKRQMKSYENLSNYSFTPSNLYHNFHLLLTSESIPTSAFRHAFPSSNWRILFMRA